MHNVTSIIAAKIVVYGFQSMDAIAASSLSTAFERLLMICKDFQVGLYALITVSVAAIGAKMMMGEDSANKAKKQMPFLIIGAILLAGAVTIGADYGGRLKF